ncbi:unnamed protein product [Pichia kudriavzevii]
MFSKSVRHFSTSAARAVSIKTVPGSAESVSTLRVSIKNAGSKSAPAGLAHLLATSTFLDTPEKSALRLKREAELVGGEYSAEVTRDALVLKATFLKESLPFFVNSSGLGLPLYFDGSKTFEVSDIATFAKSAFQSENVEIVGENVESADLEKFVSESAFATLPTGNTVVAQKQQTFSGAESRIRQAGKTSAVIGFAVEDADAFELVAAGLLSNLPESITASVESKVLSYEGSNLFYFAVTSPNAAEVAQFITTAAKDLKSVDFSKYSKLASALAEKEVASKQVSVPNDYNLVVVGDIDAVPLKSEL